MLLVYAIIVYNEYAEYVDLIVWEPNTENCLNLIFIAPPCEKVIFVCVTKAISHLQQENSCWTCQVLAAPKILALKSEPNRCTNM